MTGGGRDAGTMTAAERRSEIAWILALAYLRLLAESQNALDSAGSNEAPCDRHERTRD